MNNELVFAIYIIILGLCLLLVVNHFYQKSWINIDLTKVDCLTGIQFEKYLFYLFKKFGFRVKLTPNFADFGADLIIQKNDKKIVVQAKRYKNKVGIKSVQEAYASIAYYHCNGAMVITNSYFTSGAKKLAKSNRVELIDRDGLKKLIKKDS